MPDLRSQLRAYYETQSLAPETVSAILARGRSAAAGEALPAAEKITPFPGSRWMRPLFAIAAALVVMGGVFTASWSAKRQARVDFAAIAPRLTDFLEHAPKLEKAPQDKTELRAWLVARGAPREMEIPATLLPLESAACQVVDVQGRKTYLACFWREQRPDRGGHELVHLIVARRQDFHSAPATATPQLRELNGWTFASWSKGEIAYTLATAAPLEKLQPFLTLRPTLGDCLLAAATRTPTTKVPDTNTYTLQP